MVWFKECREASREALTDPAPTLLFFLFPFQETNLSVVEMSADDFFKVVGAGGIDPTTTFVKEIQ